MTFLDKIIAHKRKEVAAFMEHTTVKDLEESKLFSRDTISLSKFISDPAKTGIIAEFKRKSPSKGIINSRAGIKEVTVGYSRALASGLSILTDNNFFGGCCEDLTQARELNTIPILRKDFIIHKIQILEAKAAGADAILLIAAVLDREKVLDLAKTARSINLEVLLEVHSSVEIGLANEFVDIIGVNNRDLKTFGVNTELSFEMSDSIPGQFLRISESGISSPDVVKSLKKAGYNGFLIGELFMTSEDPVSAFSDFVNKIG